MLRERNVSNKATAFASSEHANGNCGTNEPLMRVHIQIQLIEKDDFSRSTPNKPDFKTYKLKPMLLTTIFNHKSATF